MTEQNPILDQLPEPRLTRLGDMAARLLMPVRNAGMAAVADQTVRTEVAYYAPDVVESALRSVVASLPGTAGKDLRQYYEIEPGPGIARDEREVPDTVEIEAVEAVAGYAVTELQAAVGHNRPVSPADLWSADHLEVIERSLAEVPASTEFWQLQGAARYILDRLVHVMNPTEMTD